MHCVEEEGEARGVEGRRDTAPYFGDGPLGARLSTYRKSSVFAVSPIAHCVVLTNCQLRIAEGPEGPTLLPSPAQPSDS